jgi:predicted GNAT superfamily acetyltransferase
MSSNQQAPRAVVDIREVSTIDEFDACIRLQREVFLLPDLEISPRRHLIVRIARRLDPGRLRCGQVGGFVHHLAAVKGDRIFGYSHMMAVAAEYQNKGVGAQLKWAQRTRALAKAAISSNGLSNRCGRGTRI